MSLRRSLTVVVALSSLAGCSKEASSGETAALLSVSRQEVLTLVGGSASRWPQGLLSHGGRLLWVYGREISQIDEAGGGLVVGMPVHPKMTLGLDRIVSAASGPRGELVLLDSGGRVSIRSAEGDLSGFDTGLGNGIGAVAISKESLFFLLQGDIEGGAAVVELTDHGEEKGRWGEMPADGLVQSVLRGGGLTVCPNGEVFYSYINSPRVLRLKPERGVEPIGHPPPDFVEMRPRDVRSAVYEGERERSTRPLVQLGLKATRVTALMCSPEDHLIRQTTNPDEGGMLIEVSDPVSGEVLGSFAHRDGMLLAVDPGLLLLGAIVNERFELRRLPYRFATPRTARNR